jgi:hypothetical protein
VGSSDSRTANDNHVGKDCTTLRDESLHLFHCVRDVGDDISSDKRGMSYIVDGVIRPASAARVVRAMMLARVYLCEALLQRLAPHFEDTAAALGQLIEKEHAMVGERHLAWRK